MRTILDTARTMLVESGLPTKYWPEAVRTTIDLRNLIPSRRHPDTIPAEMWFGKRQNVSHLRPFGSTAYAKIPTEIGISKLEPRVTKLTLVGYFGRGSYKLLNHATGTVYSGRNIIFEEGFTNYTEGAQRTEWNDDSDPLPVEMLVE